MQDGGLLSAFQELSSVAATIGREKAYPILNRLFGSTWLDHVVNKIPFRVAPLSFFQINTEQAGKLVDAVFEGAGGSIKSSDIHVAFFHDEMTAFSQIRGSGFHPKDQGWALRVCYQDV